MRPAKPPAPRPPPPAEAAQSRRPGRGAGRDAAAGRATSRRSSLTQVFVKLGRRAEGRSRSRKGLAAGDEVVTAGQNRLFNGMPVAIDNTIDPTKPDSPQAAAQ